MTGKASFISLLLLGVTFLTAACGRQPAAYTYVATPEEGWEPGDTLRFTVDSVTRAGRYTLSLGIRTSGANPYPYRSLWVVVRQRWHDPERAAVDTVECVLTDEDGDNNGRGVSLYETVRPLKDLDLPQGARAEVAVHHIMRRELLPGVTAIGLIVE